MGLREFSLLKIIHFAVSEKCVDKAQLAYHNGTKKHNENYTRSVGCEALKRDNAKV